MTNSGGGGSRDARHVPLTRVDRLRQDAAEAAQVRALSEHPDVIALAVERVRARVDRLIWAGIVLGLGFTLVNVQAFAAQGAPVWSPAWLVAWLLDPMVSLVLIAMLLAEQVTARWQVPMQVGYAGPWVRWTKRFCFAATYGMNTWTSWTHLDPAGIVLHSVPPLVVLCAAEAGPIARDRLTEAVHKAAASRDRDARPAVDLPAVWAGSDTDQVASVTTGATPNAQPNGPAGGVAVSPVNGHRPASRPSSGAKRSKRKRAPGRRFVADYVAEALAAHEPGTVVTPAWVREVVPGIGRGTSSTVAAQVKAALDTPEQAVTVRAAVEPAGVEARAA